MVEKRKIMKNKNLQTIFQSTNKAARGITPNPEKCNKLIKHLAKCLKMIKAEANERENNQRNTFRDELLKYAIPKHYINGVGNIDIAIKGHDNRVGVIFEYKRTSNDNEMMHPNRLNAKGFQELIQYYLGQITGYHKNDVVSKNTDHIEGIVTNGFSWFIVDNHELYKYFGKRKKLRKEYIAWCNGKKGDTSTRYLRDTFIEPVIDKALKHGIKIGYFDLEKMMDKGSMFLNKRYWNQFYRFLSPQNLLQEDVFTDSNELKPGFYKELLYLMGLKEQKKSKSHVIVFDKSQDSTLVNNINNRLKDNSPELSSDDRKDISIRLAVVWMNRFLFLKLLESQLYSFNNHDDSYKFLNNNNLKDFNSVYDLFFDVLAKHPSDRSKQLGRKYAKVPYLNSSLFEPTSLETHYLNINDIGDRDVDVYKHTSVKKYKKQNIKKVPILKYILDFLDAYDFSAASVRKSSKHNNLINASVLGLIFEKINGYKDGAYFTPGWICMMMAHHAIKRAVLNKINKVLNKHYSTFKDVKYIIRTSDSPTHKARIVNNAINSIKVCDPAVGSGHFLVSVLNELISVKSQLGVLFDADGNPANFECRVNNDELITTLPNGKRYYYHRDDKVHSIIQKSLFNEKKYLIENCLFGVDINPNSVEICHLRLWIELLKDAYYQVGKDGQEYLTTMPNIDINIKARNSLIHMYNLDTRSALTHKQFIEYCDLVNGYKNSDVKQHEREFLHKISKLKSRFNALAYTPDRERLAKKVNKDKEKINEYGQGILGESKDEAAVRKAKQIIATNAYKKDYKKYMDSADVDQFYKNEHGMEWRNEFPEILDKNGNYVGFDLIIGNPPYVFARNNSFNSDEKAYYKQTYNLAKYQLNTYHMFIELAYQLLKENGTFAYIVPNNILTIQSNLALRKYLVHHARDLVLINSKDKLFQGASVDNCIMFFTKGLPNTITLMTMKHHDSHKVGTVKSNFFGNNDMEPIFSISRVGNKGLMPIYNKMSNSIRLGKIAEVDTGIKVYQVGKGHPKITKEVKDTRAFHAPTQLNSNYDKYLSGADVRRYSINWGSKNPKEKWVKYGENIAEMRQPRYFKGPRILVRQIVNRPVHSITASYIDEDDVINDINSMIIRNSRINLLFILGVINSSIETVWFSMKFDKFQRKTFPQFKNSELGQFPIPTANKEQRSHLIMLVKHMLSATKNQDKDRIKHFDLTIDNYVMDLYGLTEDDKEKIRQFKL